MKTRPFDTESLYSIISLSIIINLIKSMKKYSSRFVNVPLILIWMLASVLVFPSSANATISDDNYYGPQRLVSTPNKLTNSGNTPSGAFTHDIPIKTPPGRNGIEPNLTLQYNSQNTTKGNLYGYGWDIQIPYIQRLNKYGTEKLYTSHYFTSSLSGDLEDISLTDGEHGTYGAKVDTGDFLKYNYSSGTDGWTVTDKKGTIYTFGTTSNTEQRDPNDSAKTYKWYLKEIRDLNNNYVSFEYAQDNAQVYPYKIKYTGNDVTDGIFEIEFLKEARDDDTTSYESGFAIKTLYRIYEIQAKISGTWIRKYELDYSTGDNTKRSLLTSVTETGKDESANTLTFPATSFTYQEHGDSWTEDTNWVLPEDLDSLSVFVSDINADSLPDIIQSQDVSGTHYYDIYINDGIDGWYDDTQNWDLPVALSGTNGPFAHTFLVDVDGDGYTDILKSVYSSGSRAVYINNGDGTGWTEDENYVIPFSFETAGSATEHAYRLFDVNGDGLIDVVYAKDAGGGSIEDYVYINDGDGTGWTEDTNWTLPEYFSGQMGGARYNIRVFDVNGDGLSDIVSSENTVGGHYDDVYLNNGTDTWVEDTNWTVPVNFENNGAGQRQIAIMDVNNDGLLDLVDADSDAQYRKIYLNKGDGTGWTQDTSYSVPVSVKSEDVRYFDINGDGLIDFNKADTSGGNFYDNVYENDGDEVDLLSQITTSKGAVITPLYKASTAYKDGSSNLLNVLPFTFDTVYSIATSDGVGNTSTETLSYEGGKYYYGDERDRKFAGFNKVITTDGSSYVTKNFYHQGNTTDSSNGEYSDDDSKIGQMYRSEVYDDSSNKYAQSTYKWDKYDLGNGRDFVKLIQKIDFTYDGDADHKDTAESYTYENTYGNLTQKITWGEVTGSGDGTYTDTGTDKFTYDYTYAANTTDYVVGLPSEEDVIDQNSNKVKETRFYYDAQTLGNVTDGNETKREFWKTSTTYIDTGKTYNSYGLVATEKDGRDKTTTYTYDANNLYPATVANPLSQNTTYTYDYSNGKVKTTTDPNTRVFETVYDALDRPLTEKIPDIASPGTLVNKTTYTYTDNVVPSKVQVTNHLDGSVSFDVYTYIDGLGKKIQERKEAEDSVYSVKDFVYNEVGKLKKESLPYFSSGTTRTNATTNNYLYINYTYDPLERIKTIINALGTTTNTYDQWETVTTDPKIINKDTHHDAYNQLITVEEHNGGSTYTTAYEYNGLGKLTKITDNASNLRNFTYDGLGRRLTAQDLHASGDGSYGTWTYVYDDAGNITQTIDPKSQTVNYTYDDTNRTLTEDYTGVANTEVTYVYDTGTNGIGHLYTATVYSGPVTTYTYNSRGGVASETKNISSTNYATSNEYDRQGNLTKIVYPDNAEVAYEYNTAGLLEAVSRKESGGSYTYIITDYDYAPTEKVTYKDFSNAIDTYLTYDPNKMYRLVNLFSIDPPEDEVVETPIAETPAKVEVIETSIEEIPTEIENPVQEVLDTSTEQVVELEEEVMPETITPSSQEETYTIPLLSAEETQTETVIEEKSNKAEEAPVEVVIEEPDYYQLENKFPDIGLQENKEKRTANGKIYSLGKDEKEKDIERMVLFQTPIHYKNKKTKKLEEIDTRLIPKADGWKMDKAPYSVVLKNVFENDFLSVMRNGLKLDFSLHKDEASNFSLSQGFKADSGDKKDRLIRYNNAVAPGIHIEVDAKNEALTKDIVIDSFSSIPASEKENYEVSFDVIANSAITIESEDGTIKDTGEVLSTEKVTTIKTESEDTLYIWPGIAEDAEGLSTPITLEYTKTDAGFLLTKKIPMAWLEKAAYPVRTDATVSYYAGSGDGLVSTDSFYHGTWADARNETDGDDVNYTSTDENNAVFSTSDANKFGIGRSFFPFDTSSLNDGAEITGAKLSLYVVFKRDQDDDGNDYAVVVSGTQASTSSLSLADYDQVGSTAWSSTLDFGSIGEGSRIDLNLNSSGLSNISKTSWTKLAVREGHDFANDQMANYKMNVLGVYYSERSGDYYDPYLDITYTVNTAPTAPTSLQTEGATNPIDITDGTPEFSAIYTDDNAGDTAPYYQVQVIASGGSFTSPLWDSTKTAFGTPVAKDARSADISYGGSALSMNAVKYYWRIKFWDTADLAGAWTDGTANFTVAGTPTGPTGLYSGCTTAQSGSTNPTGLKCGTPVFSATYNDSDENAISRKFRIQVNTQADFAGTTLWDSGSSGTSMPDVDEGNRSWDIVYAGDPLTYATTTYYWRIKYWDHSNLEGDWSDVATFGTYNSKVYQDNHYTYDANGNITKIVDSSDTDSARTVTYSYDDLNRLLSATATDVASGTSTYTHTYTYDSIGNILTRTDASGSYTYSGSGNYNPHAVTSIGSINYTYDDNGNMLTETSGLSNTWDYRNRLTQAVKGGITSTYTYDHTEKRMTANDGTATTTYPNNLYNIKGSVKTKHVYANNELIATVVYDGSTTTVYHDHTDHLSGTGTITSSTPSEIQTLDYFPYGNIRINDKAGSFDEQRKHTGHEYDVDTSLTYANARYYHSTSGRFLSQDPVFLNLGVDKRTEQVLFDPQLINSYSYTRNNPLIYTDPDGEIAFPAAVLAVVSIYGYLSNLIDAYEFKTVVIDYPEVHSIEEINRAGNQIISNLVLFGAGRISTTIEKAVLDIGTTTLDVLDNYFGEDTYKNLNDNKKSDILPSNSSNSQSSSNLWQSTSTISEQKSSKMNSVSETPDSKIKSTNNKK